MTSKDDRSVTVIGAGIVGICCALALIEKGVEVRLIDRGAPEERRHQSLRGRPARPDAAGGVEAVAGERLLEPLLEPRQPSR